MLNTAIETALAIELILLAIEKLLPTTSRWLPLGRDHVTQIAILLLLAIGIAHLCNAFGSAGKPPPESRKLENRSVLEEPVASADAFLRRPDGSRIFVSRLRRQVA